ncbi:MAG TPA: DUF3383 family protein, partial [Acidimicrobiales bacterium]|nr:DUF3383 family protein [Acidimicrobiales bacterium]
FPERFRVYTAVADMVEDGFPASSAIVRAVSAILSQQPKVQRVIVGRRDGKPTTKHALTPTAVHLAKYTVTVDGKEASFTADATSTVAKVSAGLVAAINAVSGGAVTAAAVGGAGTETGLTITAKVAGEVYSLELATTLGAKLSVEETTADVGIADDIAALALATGDWYGLVLVSQGKAEILAAAAVIESMRRILGVTSMDSDILDGVATTDLASQLKAAGYARTFLLYSPAAHEYGAAAWMGNRFPGQPGGSTWKFKTLRGVSVYSLTASQEAAAKAKNANTYTSIGGVSITAEGVTASGEFIDVTHGVDWLQAQLQEGVYSLLVNSDKVPFTDGGVALVENVVRGCLARGVSADLLAADPEPTVSVPRVRDVPQPDRAARHLPDVRFEAVLAGAVHSLTISGTITV